MVKTTFPMLSLQDVQDTHDENKGYGLGSVTRNQERCERGGKPWKDNTKFTDRQPITDANLNKSNLFTQLSRRMSLKHYSRFDFGKVDLRKNVLEHQKKLDNLRLTDEMYSDLLFWLNTYWSYNSRNVSTLSSGIA